MDYNSQNTLHSSSHYSPMKPGESTLNANFIARHAMRFNLNLDASWSYRQQRLEILRRFLDGTIYDNLAPFYTEYNNNNYIPLVSRRPSVVYPLCKIIVDQSTSMLFGESHFPMVRCQDLENPHEDTTQFLQYVTRASKLHLTMLEAAKKGSLGSVCVVLKVLNKKFNFEVITTQTLTPIFDRMDPTKLERLIDKRVVDGGTLQSAGYTIENENITKFYYFIREWTKTEEIYYKPYLCDEEDGKPPKKDNDRSSIHDFKFVPAVWIKNLPESNDIDGGCTFDPAIDNSIEIDYQLSQNGRLLKYNSDPTLVIKNPVSLEGNQLIKSAGILSLDEKGDAFYAEMSGKSSEAVLEFIKILREYALEAVQGNRTSPDKISTAQSGKAHQMLNNALIGLVEEMRLTYGECGLMEIYCMILDIVKSNKYELDYDGHMPDIDKNCESHLMLDWPDWYPPTSMEKLQEAQALTTYVEGGLLSRKTAVESIADEYNILDVEEEVDLIEKNMQQAIDNKQDSAYNKNTEKSSVVRDE